jgi:catechol 2,3-dioxygenase-like lactoylglutathione lyase family enzyme
MSQQALPTAAFYGAYLQVADLSRSLAFYSGVMGLDTAWNDGEIAVLHPRDGSQDTLVLRALDDAPHHLGDAGVTRLLWRVTETTDLDVAEQALTDMGVRYSRHKDVNVDGLSFRDPDGLDVVLVRKGPPTDATPPSWMYWTN